MVLRFVETLVAAAGSDVRHRDDLHLAAGSEPVLEGRGIGADEADDLAGLGDVQKPVAGGEIEELALPQGDPLRRAARFLDDLDVEGGEDGGRLERLRRRLLAAGGLACDAVEAERPDLLQAGAANVDRHRAGVLGEVPHGGFRRSAESGRRGMRRERRLEDDKLAEVDPPAQGRRLVGEERRELDRLQPEAGEGVARSEDQQRVEARLFEGRGEEQRRVEAGRDAAVENGAGRAHLLPDLLEARRRQGVGDPQADDGGPDCGGEFPGPLAGFCCVAVDAVRTAGSAQHVRGRLEDAVDGRIVRHDEGRQQFGHGAESAPFAARQQFDGVGRGADDLSGTLQPQDQVTTDALREVAEQRRVEGDVTIEDVEGGLRPESIDAPGFRRDEGRVGGENERKIVDLAIGVVRQGEFAQDRNGILV